MDFIDERFEKWLYRTFILEHIWNEKSFISFTYFLIFHYIIVKVVINCWVVSRYNIHLWLLHFFIYQILEIKSNKTFYNCPHILSYLNRIVFSYPCYSQSRVHLDVFNKTFLKIGYVWKKFLYISLIFLWTKNLCYFFFIFYFFYNFCNKTQ